MVQTAKARIDDLTASIQLPTGEEITLTASNLQALKTKTANYLTSWVNTNTQALNVEIQDGNQIETVMISPTSTETAPNRPTSKTAQTKKSRKKTIVTIGIILATVTALAAATILAFMTLTTTKQDPPRESTPSQVTPTKPATPNDTDLKPAPPSYTVASANPYSGVITIAIKTEKPDTFTIWVANQKSVLKAPKPGTYQTTFYDLPHGQSTWRVTNNQEAAIGKIAIQ